MTETPDARPVTPPIPATARTAARRRVLVSVVVGAVVAIVLALVVASLVSVPYYALTPGDGLPVGSLISVPRDEAVAHRGAVLLTDVRLTPLRALSYLYYRFLDSSADVVADADVTGYATTSQYAEQGVIDMGNARQAAAVNALRALGYATRAEPDGIIVYQPLPRSPAASALRVGDVVTALDGTPTPTPAALHAALARLRPGVSVSLTVHGYVARNEVTAAPAPSPSRTVSLRVGVVAATEDGVPICVADGARGIPAGAHAPCLGIDSPLFEVEQSYATLEAPFPVSISADDIDGPSAGLAFTLGLIDKLDRDDLTNGRRIAATGTMSMDGVVGDVGGVAQKTIAVRAAGASVFLVPPQEYAVARAHAGSALKVYKVASLTQAISVLRTLGGRLTPRAGSVRGGR